MSPQFSTGKFKSTVPQVIGLSNGDEVSKEFRPYKQMIERLNRTYKASYSPTNGFDGIDGANYDLALRVAYLVWDFRSLLIMVQMCFSFMLTDKDSDMRLCKYCKKAFIASRKGNEFCSPQCRTSITSINQGKRRKGTKEMIENRNVNIVTDADGKKLVVINDIRFKAKVRDD